MIRLVPMSCYESESETLNYRSILKKHRGAIMGLMAILIFFYHSQLPISFPLYRLTIGNGRIGVDVFFFLSGFGLTYSLEKSTGLGDYMGRRLRRILPTWYAYLLISFFLCFLFSKPMTLYDILIRLIPVGEWLNAGFNRWYVSTILGYYIIAALLFPLLHRSKYLYVTSILLLVLTGWYSPVISRTNNTLATIVRLPGLVTGLAVGCAAKREEPRYRKGILGFMGLMILWLLGISMYIFSTHLQSTLFKLFDETKYSYLRMSLLAPFLSILIAYVLEACDRIGLGFMNRLFDWFGKYSLEFYLCHMPLLNWISGHFSSRYLCMLVAFLLSCPFSMFIQWAGKKLYLLWMLLISRLSLKE